MDTTRAEQIALDDALVAPANRLKIGKSNLRLSSDLKSKEATLQVVYDVLKLTPFYKAFQITADVPEIYMQEFWATAKVHHHSIRFKMNNKKHIVNLEYFRQMLQICPKLPDQQFEELPFEEEILTFLRDLGHSGEIKVITDVNVNKLHQPWRSFAAVINKCLSGKSTGYDSLRLSQAQILWGMYHKKNVDYAYLLWEDFVYQVENKNVKRSNEMYYPRFTKVIVNFFMTKDQSIPRRNKVNWHFARDDPMFTTIKVVSRHEDTQLYGAILPIDLTNEAIKDSESYKEYYAIASGAEPPKTKASVKKKQVESDKAKTPPATKGKRLKTTAKVTKPSMKKQPTQGLETLSEVALTEEEQMRIVTKRSLTEYHSSYASGSGADEGTGVTPGVPDVPKYGSDDEQISWKSSSDEDDDAESKNDDDDDDADNQDDDDNDDDDQNDDNTDNENDDNNDDDDGQDHEQTDSDNDGDDFVHPKFSTHDEEDKEEDSFDPRVQTPSHVESTDDEDSDEEIQGANVEGEELDEEETNEEDEANELYKDVNVNLEGRDTEMTDAPRTIIQTTQVIEDTHVIITPVNPEGQQQSSSVSSGFVSNMLNPSPDTGIDSIFNLNTESTSLVDVSVTTIAEPPLLSATILPPPPTPLITHLQQTPVPTPATVPSSSLQDLPNFVVFLIPGIVDAYLANKMHEAVKTAIQLQSDRLRDEAQAKNEDFINKLDDNIKKIIKDQVKEQEDFVYQVENKNVKRSNEMYYPRFTKVIVNFFMTKVQSIPRRNKVNWHFARDDPMFTTIKVFSRHEDTQLYGVMLPNELTNEYIKISESYKKYYAIASGVEPPNTKESVKKKQVESDKAKTPPTIKVKRLKTSAKAAKPAKKKQLAKMSKAKGLTVLSEVALTEAKQIKLATKRSLIQTHSSHVSGSGADEGTEEDDDEVGMNEDDDDDADNQDDESQGDDDEKTDSDNDGDEFVHPKFFTHDEEDKEEDSFYPRVQTLSHVESTNDEEIHGANVEGDKQNKEGTNEEEEKNSWCECPDTGIDSLFNLNTESTSLVDVPVTTVAKPPLLSTITLPPPPTPLITHPQQTPVPSPATVPSSSLQDLPNFGSLFGFDHKLKTLESDFSKFKQTNQFVEAISIIPGIVNAYLANKMHEAIQTAIQLQSERLRDEAQAENEDFINKIDDNIKKIIKDQVKAQALVDAYESDKLILSTYGDTVSFKRRRDDEDKDEEPSVGSNWGSKRRRAGKEPELTSDPKEKTSKTTGKLIKGSKSHHKSAQAENPMHTAKDLEEPIHQEFKTGVTDDQPDEETSQRPDWFQKPAKPPTPARDWNKTLPDAHGPVQPWISSLDQMKDPRESFNELMDTPLDFSAFMMNRLKVDTLTPELLAGPTFELMKRSYWNNPGGQQYPHDLRKSLPLIPNSRGHRVIPFDHFINNDLEYLKCGVKCRLAMTNMHSGETHIGGENDNNSMDLRLTENLLEMSTPNAESLLDDDKLYKFKEGDFKRLRIQYIKDMLLLLVQGKLINLTVEEHLAFNFSDGTLNDVRTALNDLLKGIRMPYLPQTIWRQSDRDKAGAMIKSIDIQLKTRRIYCGSLEEKFVSGRTVREDKMDSMHSTLSMYYDYDAPVKGELLVMMKNSQSVNLWIFISNTLIELFNDFGLDCDGIPKRPTMYLNLWSYKIMMMSLLNSALMITHVLERFDTLAGNPVNEILLNLNLPNHRSILTNLKCVKTASPKALDGITSSRQRRHKYGGGRNPILLSVLDKSTSDNKKKGVVPTNEVSNSNPFEVLNSVDNDVELGTNGGTTNLVNNGANSSGSFFMNVDNSSTITTHIIDKIEKFEDLLISGQAILVDETGNPLKKVEGPGDYDCEDKVASVDNDMAHSMFRKGRLWHSKFAGTIEGFLW
ncbi:uncharacterized mitochondrial protein-like protein [Tanacetum coccineum]